MVFPFGYFRTGPRGRGPSRDAGPRTLPVRGAADPPGTRGRGPSRDVVAPFPAGRDGGPTVHSAR